MISFKLRVTYQKKNEDGPERGRQAGCASGMAAQAADAADVKVENSTKNAPGGDLPFVGADSSSAVS